MRSWWNVARSHGFTLIELLVVVAVIGLIAVLLIPNLLDAVQRSKQKRTMADMKVIGATWFSWLTDQVGAGAAGSSQSAVDWADFNNHSYDDLVGELVPDYAEELPRLDGWKRTFEFGIASDLDDPVPVGIRSPGSDGVFSTTSYEISPFAVTDYDQDIVWAGGFFVRWPATLTPE